MKSFNNFSKDILYTGIPLERLPEFRNGIYPEKMKDKKPVLFTNDYETAKAASTDRSGKIGSIFMTLRNKLEPDKIENDELTGNIHYKGNLPRAHWKPII